MIVTTTNSIEGREISRYKDPIAANVVIGTNIFSERGELCRFLERAIYQLQETVAFLLSTIIFKNQLLFIL
ncbi:heavy metal-binding domain-containing protein [Sphingobacterium sp. GVS05A]|uniref:heavy metal-binding domain-containing protein n=1 Tax=Sphingobacterium sp. GVS05A TaxID=2862679 RepID=UPI001CBBA055